MSSSAGGHGGALRAGRSDHETDDDAADAETVEALPMASRAPAGTVPGGRRDTPEPTTSSPSGQKGASHDRAHPRGGAVRGPDEEVGRSRRSDAELAEAIEANNADSYSEVLSGLAERIRSSGKKVDAGQPPCNVMRRHPKTQFVCLHVADAEDLLYVSECLETHPNMHVEIAARIGELGRQPRAAAKFIDKYQDRVLFGTDAIPKGTDTPQQVFNDELYEIYYRFLESEDEYFNYAPAAVPPQGRWRIYGIGLSDQILKKVYAENAARLLGA